MQVKYSRQRELIMHFLEGRCDHPTADMIYGQLRKNDPKLSLGTVYRNLSLLEKLGRIRTIKTGDGKDHYDPNMRPHSHLICRQCGAVLDIDTICPDSIREDAQLESGGAIEDVQLFFFGLCSGCAAENKDELTKEA